MRRWVTPRATVEDFMPNEYCSTCWGVACNIGPANEYDEHQYGVDHTPDHCGNASNQVVRDLDGDGTADLMQEIGTDGLGTLNCVLYRNGGYRRRKDIGSVHPGDYIYWTTSAADGRTWHHQGMVEQSFPGQPNRS